jgi:Uma2 family endonuclease
MPAALLQPAKPKVFRRNGGGMLSSEQFLHWLQPGVFADLIGGQISMHSPVNLRHATLVSFMDHLLHSYIEKTDLGGALYRGSVAVRLSARETFMPDLGYFTARQAERLGESHAAFAPMFVAEALSPSTAKNDLGPKLGESHAAFAPMFVAEALSPSTAKNDLGPKFASYELHEVQEYWILDPQKLQHRFFRRAGDMLEEFAASSEKITSTSIQGFWVKRAWLDPDKTPKVSACLKEIMRGAKRQ